MPTDLDVYKPERWVDDALFRPETRAAFQKLVAEEVPDIGILTAPDVTIYNTRVRDHTVTAEGVSGNLADVYLAG